jgi:hypothetical protein
MIHRLGVSASILWNRDKSITELTLGLGRQLFPFLPRDPEIRITKVAILFETEECWTALKGPPAIFRSVRKMTC